MNKKLGYKKGGIRLDINFPLRFNLRAQEKPGYINVRRDQIFTENTLYGYMPGVNHYNNFKFCTRIPVGNYDVKMVFGQGEFSSVTTVKISPRRLLLKDILTQKFEFREEEVTICAKDEILIFEVLGQNPAISEIIIDKAKNPIVVYLAGDSTVCDQENEPFAGWGQALPCFFKRGVAVSNHAYSGRSSKSFIEERRLEKILETIKEGDYLFIQFGHNDQKDDKRYTEAHTSYKIMLKVYIDEARKRGAIPVLITPVARRHFDENGRIVGAGVHYEYPNAMRQLAMEERVELIDLLEKSKKLLEEYGIRNSERLFVRAKPGEYPNFPDGIQDDTHFNEFGAYEMAKLVAEGIRKSSLALKEFLRD